MLIRRTDAAWFDHDLNEDMLSFIDPSVFHVMAGYDNLGYGTFFETSGGCDGIMPGDSRLVGAGHEHPMIRRKYIGEEVLGEVYGDGIECVRGRERFITV
jgi:hypothetical protein